MSDYELDLDFDFLDGIDGLLAESNQEESRSNCDSSSCCEAVPAASSMALEIQGNNKRKKYEKGAEISIVWERFYKCKVCEADELPACKTRVNKKGDEANWFYNAAKCKDCHRCYAFHTVGGPFTSNSGTTSLLEHVCDPFKKRRIENGAVGSNVRTGAAPAVQRLQTHLQHDVSGNMIAVSRGEITQKGGLMRIYMYCIMSKVPFTHVSNNAFKWLMKYFAPKFQVPADTTVKRNVVQLYSKLRIYIRSKLVKLKRAGNMFNLTTDISEFNKIGYIVVTIRYIELSSGKMRRFLLDFTEMKLPHTGENIKLFLQSTMKEFDITDAVLSVAFDNASNNLKAVKEVLRDESLMSILPFSGRFLLQRCCAHILNLLSQAALRTCRSELEALRAVIVHSGTAKQYAELVKCIEKAQPSLLKYSVPDKDTPTRWGSCSQMIDDADVIEDGLIEYSKSLVAEGAANVVELTPTMFDNIRVINKFLKPLKIMSHNLCVTDIGANITKAYWIICDLTKHIEDAKFKGILTSFHYDEDIEDKAAVVLVGRAANQAHEKHIKYFSEIPESFQLGAMLDPNVRTSHLKNPAEREVWNALFCEVFEMRYSQLPGKQYPSTTGAPSTTSTNTSTAAATAGTDKEMSSYDAFMSAKVAAAPTQTLQSEAEEYLQGECSSNVDTLTWWFLNRTTFPRLYIMAMHFLSMECTTIQSEAAFSEANGLLGDERKCMVAETVQALMLTRAWLTASERYGWGLTSDAVCDGEEEL